MFVRCPDFFYVYMFTLFRHEATFVQAIRQQIATDLGIHASAGIAGNLLLARMATRKAKPNGQYSVASDAALAFMATAQIRDLPGVGWAGEEKLVKLLGVHCIASLRAVSLPRLVTFPL